MSLSKNLVTLVLACLVLTGCSNMKLKEVAVTEPKFDFAEYFSGHTKASGWFTNRFGQVKRHFCGDFFGSIIDGKFVLDEQLYYLDGIVEERVWTLTMNDSGFVGEGDALVGQVIGEIEGNTLQLLYSMRVEVSKGKTWTLNFNDWMFLQPDGSLHNHTKVSKWGLNVGTVTTQYTQHEGELLCKLAS